MRRLRAATSPSTGRRRLRPRVGAPARAGAANDGNSTTRWSSTYTDNQWWQVDLGAVRASTAWRSTGRRPTPPRTASRPRPTARPSPLRPPRTSASPRLRVTSFPARSARYIRVVGDVRATPFGISFWDFARVRPAPPRRRLTPIRPRRPSTPARAARPPRRRRASPSAPMRRARRSNAASTAARGPAAARPRATARSAAAPHTFDVRATDSAANVDPTPASRNWTVDPPATGADLALNRPATASSTGGERGHAGSGERRQLGNPLVVDVHRQPVVAGRPRHDQVDRPRGGQLGGGIRLRVPHPDLHRRHDLHRPPRT